jgi:Zn-dependent protease
VLGQLGNFTGFGVRTAVYLLVGLLIGMSAREFARAWTAARLHDPTPRLWGRLTMNPKSWFDPFGSGLVPGLIAVLWAASVTWSPAAYGKPAPIDPSYFRRHTRDVVVVSLAGPVATLALAFVAGVLLRVVSPGGSSETVVVLAVFAYAFSGLTVFHLLPIPGLDGARIVALFLPPQAAQVYRNADRYLSLFVLVLLFLFGSFILRAMTDAVCSLATGRTCIVA